MKNRVKNRPLTNLWQEKNYLIWIVYALSALLVLLLQTAPHAFPSIGGSRPFPLLTFVICVAIFSGARTGAIIGILAGALWGVFSFRPFGYDALLLMLFGLVAGLLVEWFFRANFFTALLLCSCGIFLYILIEWVFCYVIFQKENLFEIFFRVLLPNGLYTFVLTPAVFGFSLLIARFVRRKVNN